MVQPRRGGTSGAAGDRAERLRPDESLEETVARLVRVFKVSSLVILQRLRDARRLTWDELREAYQSELDRISKLPKAPQM